MRLFRTITLMLIILTAVPVTTIGIILIQSNLDTLKTLTWEAQQERVDHVGQEISNFTNRITQDVDLLFSSLDIETLNIRERQELLSLFLQKHPEINIIGFYDTHGVSFNNLLAFDSNRILPSELAAHQAQLSSMIGASTQPVTFSSPDSIHRDAKPQISIPERREIALSILMRLEAAEVTFLGMEVSLTVLQDIIEKMQSSQGGQFLVVDSKQNIVLESGALDLFEQEKNRFAGLIMKILPTHTTLSPSQPRRVSGALPLKLENGKDVLAAYTPLVQPPWLVLSIEPLDEAYSATRTMTWQVVWVAIISLTAAGGLGILFAFNITKPISKCVKGALAIARGNFGFTLNIRARNEVGELAHTFNYMSKQLLFYDQKNKELVETLQRGYLETIRALANSIDAKDPYTRGHSDRVTELAIKIGNALKLSGQDMLVLRFGGILHDIGKIGISEQILGKQQTLSEEEREVIRQHPVMGEKIIEPIDFLAPVRPLVRHHHERMDGTGYPDGLQGDQIPFGARIINAADTFDAVTSERPYQTAVPRLDAIEILLKLRSTQIDPGVCDALIDIIRKETSSDT
jgi:putative nucleotidyltransferase with HDIG domain